MATAAVQWLASLVLLATAITSLHASTERWQELRVRHQRTAVGAGVSGFWSVPATYLAALQAGWAPAPAPGELGVLAVAAAAGDLAFTPLYRANLAGRLVGFCVTVPVADVYRSGPHDALPAAPGGSNEVVWLQGAYYVRSTALLVSPAELRVRTADPLQERLTDANGLWLRNASAAGGYSQLPTDLSQLLSTTLYTKQGCASGMGTKYYYNMSETTAGASENTAGASEETCGEWSPWSVLGEGGTVVGLGWQLFGSPVVYGRDWYDDIPSAHVPSHAAALATTAPGACAMHRRWAEHYGLISLHVFFVSEPWTLDCEA